MENRKGEETFQMVTMQAEELKDIMAKNVEKVLERENNLDNLLMKSENLETSTDLFEKMTTKVRRKSERSNRKQTCICVVVVIFIVICVILFFIFRWLPDHNNPSATTLAPSQTTFNNKTMAGF